MKIFVYENEQFRSHSREDVYDCRGNSSLKEGPGGRTSGGGGGGEGGS